MRCIVFGSCLLLFVLTAAAENKTGPLQLATFVADVTPPIGSPLCFSFIAPAKQVEEPLTARGVVLLGPGKPIVLCVADFVVLANESHDAWREALAEAAGTSPDRVAMHVIHNHDSPGYDRGASRLLDEQDLPDRISRRDVHDQAIADTAAALRASLGESRPVTHIGTASARVEQFASNRRIIGENGKLVLARMSSCRNEKAIAEPEGTIDPDLDLISFWENDTPLAVLTFYASHPQSYYGRGGITPDTVGLARNRRTEETGVFHVHFDGAGGNVAAGKYNDGSPKARARLTDRIHAGMRSAWESQEKSELSGEDLSWNVRPTQLPWSGRYTEAQLARELSDPEVDAKTRIRAARDLVYLRRWQEGKEIDLQCLRLGQSRALFFPGELFVEYQLAAKKMRPEQFVTVAAYGDGGPGYIGTEAAYPEGGYEVGRVSRTAPEVEAVLDEAIRDLLELEQP